MATSKDFESYECLLVPGDLIKISDRGQPGFTTEATRTSIFGENPFEEHRVSEDDVFLVVDVKPAKYADLNEHAVLLLCSRGIGWAWRGYFDKF